MWRLNMWIPQIYALYMRWSNRKQTPDEAEMLFDHAIDIINGGTWDFTAAAYCIWYQHKFID